MKEVWLVEDDLGHYQKVFDSFEAARLQIIEEIMEITDSDWYDEAMTELNEYSEKDGYITVTGIAYATRMEVHTKEEFD